MISKFFLLLFTLTIFTDIKSDEALGEALESLPETLGDVDLMKTLAILFVGHQLNTPNRSKQNKIQELIQSIKHKEAVRYQKKRDLSDRLLELNTSMGDLDEIVDTLESSITSKASSLRISVSSLDIVPGNVPLKDRAIYLQKISEGFNNRASEPETTEEDKKIRKIRKLKRKKKKRRKLMKKGVSKEKMKLVNEIKKLQSELKKRKSRIVLGKRKF